jgi:RecA-family ATPase
MIIANQWEGIDPCPREWIVEDWVPANHVTGVYGDGGIGKTLVVQQLLTAVASGEPWLGMDVKPSKAFGFLCEDFENDIHITQQAINRDLGITMRSLGDLAFMSRVGEDNVLMSFDKSDTGMLTPLYYELVSSIKDFGAKVVVIDTLADTFGGSENVRTQARQFVANCLGRMAREIGGTVIVCGHPSIAGMQSGQGYGGSTAWNNTFRSRLYLTRPEDDGDNNARTLERKKANYASTGEPLQLLWADGVLGLAEQKQTSGGPTNNVSLDLARTILTEIEAKWNAKKPYSSANNSGERYVGKMIQKNFKMKKKAAQELVHVWWQNGVIDDQVVDTHTKLKGLKVTKWPG